MNPLSYDVLFPVLRPNFVSSPVEGKGIVKNLPSSPSFPHPPPTTFFPYPPPTTTNVNNLTDDFAIVKISSNIFFFFNYFFKSCFANIRKKFNPLKWKI